MEEVGMVEEDMEEVGMGEEEKEEVMEVIQDIINNIVESVIFCNLVTHCVSLCFLPRIEENFTGGFILFKLEVRSFLQHPLLALHPEVRVEGAAPRHLHLRLPGTFCQERIHPDPSLCPPQPAQKATVRATCLVCRARCSVQ